MFALFIFWVFSDHLILISITPLSTEFFDPISLERKGGLSVGWVGLGGEEVGTSLYVADGYSFCVGMNSREKGEWEGGGDEMCVCVVQVTLGEMADGSPW